MRRSFGFVLIAVFGVVLLVTFSPVVAVEGELTIQAGTVFFDRPEFDSVVLVEFPFSLVRDQFEFFQPDSADNLLYARVFAQVNLFDTAGLPVDSANTYFSAAVADNQEAGLPGYQLFNSLTLVVPPGRYSGRLQVIDVVSKAEGEFFFEQILVEPPNLVDLSLGGESLAHRLTYIGDRSPIGSGVPRNGYEVLCNPLGLFSTEDTAIAFYVEVYNLDYRTDSASEFRISLVALEESGHGVRHLGALEKRKTNHSVVVAESFDIAGWTPGSYLLRMTVSDPSSKQEISRDLPFKIITPRQIAADTRTVTLIDPCDTLSIEVQLRLIYYLVTPEEKKTLGRLTDIGKRTFVEQYWRERDSDPTTVIIENRYEMYSRYLYSNNFFSFEEGKTDGWFSDRGRILMVYGFWDQLRDAVHPTRSYPYQVWQYYDINEGAVFVFEDDHGFGDYRLVHSNVESEMFDDWWHNALRDGFFEIEE